MTCKTKYVLGEKGRDGCQTCACLPEAQPPAVVLKPEPERHECLAVAHCIVSCHHGYSLSGQGECQKCSCNPAPTQPPARHQECTATLNCMLSCKHGYQLGSAGHDGCPECLCLQPQPQKVEVIPVKLVTCSSALTCSAGCTVGYKCGDDGCPTCECIHPQVVGILHVTEVHTSKQVSCTTAFSCPDKCTLGYKCGDDGCPTCECLIAVHTETSGKLRVIRASKIDRIDGVVR
ncbi:hypothetical protein CHS0354_009616 [Potamilus streckersoni]|uniref:Antistasin-like domain-containing protein n=1 Tax=Potamilus streckersoni TaxID=2493646 RepID=A0AAE0TIR4_9BIVA|nr:hypothetical protein CHS0354_009616 [Potamilus streckersoni]